MTFDTLRKFHHRLVRHTTPSQRYDGGTTSRSLPPIIPLALGCRRRSTHITSEQGSRVEAQAGTTVYTTLVTTIQSDRPHYCISTHLQIVCSHEHFSVLRCARLGGWFYQFGHCHSSHRLVVFIVSLVVVALLLLLMPCLASHSQHQDCVHRWSSLLGNSPTRNTHGNGHEQYVDVLTASLI